MYEIDSKYLNSDGSVNVEKAIEAGRRARTEALRTGIEALRTMAGRSRKAAWRRLSTSLAYCKAVATPRSPKSGTS